MKSKPQLYRQGDVALVPVLLSSLPAGAKDVTPQNGDVILKSGEVTGHAHRIAKGANVRLWSAGAERFLQVIGRSALTHEEHATIDIAPGLYHIPEQVEWTDEQEHRVVAD